MPVIKTKNPRGVVVVLDATFFGRRVDKFGLIIAKDIYKGSPVSYHFIAIESFFEYQILLRDILQVEFIIKAAVIDGKRGLFGLLGDIPVQMCHFHQQAIITRYLVILEKPKYFPEIGTLEAIKRYNINQET